MLEGDLLGDEANGITHDITDGGGNQGAEEDGFDRVAGSDAGQEGDGESQGSKDPGDEGGEFHEFLRDKKGEVRDKGSGSADFRVYRPDGGSDVTATRKPAQKKPGLAGEVPAEAMSTW